MNSSFWGRLGLCGLILAACIGTVIANDDNEKSPRSKKDEQDGPEVSAFEFNRVLGAPIAGGTAALSPIIKHSGPVMTTPKIYLIWYGSWNQTNNSDTPAGQVLVKDFLHGLSNSPYYRINTTYAGPTGTILFGGETTVSARRNSTLTDSGVLTQVKNAINGGQFPADPNGIYVVLTSSDIAKTGFCTSYCGWHSRSTIKATDIKYSFVGNANRCLNACSAQTAGPNGNAGVDGMLSVLAHEIEEANTDPDLNAWFDASGAENADKCAWTFGSAMLTAANGALYNMTLPGQSTLSRNYLIQRNLSAADNKCYVNFDTKQQ